LKIRLFSYRRGANIEFRKSSGTMPGSASRPEVQADRIANQERAQEVERGRMTSAETLAEKRQRDPGKETNVPYGEKEASPQIEVSFCEAHNGISFPDH
jgi:hypothetical protein